MDDARQNAGQHYFESTEADAADVLLEGLFDGNLIDLNRGSVFDRTPGPLDLDGLHKNGRIEGMLLGLAAGDALGLPTEFTYTPERRRAELGTIRGHEDNPAELRGSVSDDTQLSFWTLQRLPALGRLDPGSSASAAPSRSGWANTRTVLGKSCV